MKKCPVLTGRTCQTMELLRMAIEVLTGKRVCFVCLDLNTCSGKVRIGDEEIEIDFLHSRKDLIEFELNEKEKFVGLFDNDLKEVKVAHQDNSHVRNTIAGSFTMRWVGSSANDRREEPLFPEYARYSAKVRFVTVEELLEP